MLRIKNRVIIYLLGAALLALSVGIQAQTGYQKPPKAILDVLDAPANPFGSVSPAKDRMVLVTPSRYPSITELAEPMLRLAGLRINPKTNGPHRASSRITALTLKTIADGRETKITLPPNSNMGMLQWSPDSKQFAAMNTTANGIELWIGDAATGKLRKIAGVTINWAYGDPMAWMPDSQTMLVQTVVAGRGSAPVRSGRADRPEHSGELR